MPEMPEGCPVCEARRVRGRQRTAKWRAKGKGDATVTSRDGGDVTPTYKGEPPGDVTPSHTLPVGEKTLTVETGKGVEAILAPFEARGYRHEPAFWAKMAARYPGVDLELEAMKLAEWLDTPKNAKALCSKARVDHWLKKAHAELQAPAPPPWNGTTKGVRHAPVTRQHNRQPDAPRLLEGDLVPIRRDDFHQYVAERRRLPLEQRVAQYKGAAK